MSFAEIRGSGLGAVIAENNSSKFYIKVIGTHGNNSLEERALTGVYVNNVKVTGSASRGVNFFTFDENMNLLKTDKFDIYGNTATIAQVISFFDNVDPNRLVAMVTADAITGTDPLYNKMASLGSSVWPKFLTGSTDTNVRRFAYCCLYDSNTKNIISEAAGSRMAGYPAEITYFMDTLKDLGSTGAGKSLVEDPDQYSGSAYLIKSYIERQTTSNFPQIQSTDWLQIRADFKQDAAATTANVECMITVQFFNSAGQFIKGINLRTKAGADWETFDTKAQIPAGAGMIDAGFYHYPSTTAGKGNCFVRNVVIQPTNADNKKTLSARLGRFSAPTEKYEEKDMGNTVARFTKDEYLEAKEMQEASGGEWVKILDHRLLGSNKFVFATKQQAQNSDIPYLFSMLNKIEDFRRSDGTFKFKLEYEPERGNAIWTQTSSPFATVATGFQVESNTFVNSDRPLGGIRASTIADTMFDCSPAGSTNWFYSVGALKTWGTNQGLPAMNNAIPAYEVRLYVWKE